MENEYPVFDHANDKTEGLIWWGLALRVYEALDLVNSCICSNVKAWPPSDIEAPYNQIHVVLWSINLQIPLHCLLCMHSNAGLHISIKRTGTRISRALNGGEIITSFDIWSVDCEFLCRIKVSCVNCVKREPNKKCLFLSIISVIWN